MIHQLLDVLQQRHIRKLDLLACAVLLGYAMVAFSTQSGVSISGLGLDPVFAGVQQRDTLRVAVDLGFYPFSDLQNDELVGYDIDLARAIGDKMGLRVEFVPTTVEAVYEDLSNGKADIAASALPYAPHQGWRVTFSEFYFNAGQVLVVRKNTSITGQDQLSNLTIGASLGSDADTYARNLAVRDSSIVVRSEYDLPAEVIDDLRSDVLDAVIVDNATALSAIGRYNDLKMAEALTLEPYVIVLPREAFLLRERVNQALEDLRDEGFFESNGYKWFVEAPTPTPRPE